MTRYVKIQAAGAENFAYLLGLFNEGGYTVDRFAGGNEFYVPEDLDLPDDLRTEVAAAVRPGTLPPQFQPADTDRSPAPSTRAAVDDVPSEVVEAEQESLPPLPPRSGAGSGRGEWAKAAEARKLVVAAEMTRDEIMRAVDEHDEKHDSG
jgi:hypothetical protein